MTAPRTGLLLSDDRAYLRIEHPDRFAFGDLAAPLLVLNDADGFGCAWLAERPEGWYAPTVTTPVDRRPAGHGGYAGEPSYEPRTLSFEGTVTAPTAEALDAAADRLLDAVLGSAPAQVRYTHLDAEPPRGLWLLPTGTPKWQALDDRVATFAFVMIAEDPVKTGATATYGPVRLPTVGGEGGYVMGAAGLVMPATSTGGTVAFTVAQVANPGNESAHAVYTVTGPVPQPRVQLGDGSYVALSADLGALDSWVIDTAAGTSAVNGVNRYDAWAAGSTFPLIPKGGVEVRLRSAAGGTSQAAGLTITTAPSWR